MRVLHAVSSMPWLTPGVVAEMRGAPCRGDVTRGHEALNEEQASQVEGVLQVFDALVCDAELVLLLQQLDEALEVDLLALLLGEVLLHRPADWPYGYMYARNCWLLWLEWRPPPQRAW